MSRSASPKRHGRGLRELERHRNGTPIVWGLATLIIEKFPKLSEPDLRGELLDSVRPLPIIPVKKVGLAVP